MRIILAFAVALAALALVGRTAVSAIPEESRTGPSAPPTGTSAPPTGPPAPPHLSDLYEANYITAHEVSARLHHGDLFINSGVVAIFPGLSRRLGGMFIGDVDFVLTTLPRGEGVLNLFREINPRKRTVAFNVEAAYLSAQYSEEVYVYPSGYATAVRSWDELEKQEQEQFEAIYLQAYSDAWLVEEQTGESGGLALRDPVGKEIYAAFWTREGERFDYRVDESGEKLTIDNYSKGVRFFESPWSPEEGELDENVQFSSLHYTYGLGSTDPVLGDGSEFSLEIRAAFTVKEDCASIRLVSAPWVNCESLHLFDVILPWEDEPFTIERGATGFSDWIVTVKTPLQAGKQYALDCLSAQPFPQSYEGIGYGGVYRFDSSPLWPGEDSSVNITISAWLPGEEWAAVASGNPPVSLSREPSTTDPPSAITKVTMQWEASTRSQMIVATQFPMRKLQTDWGVLEVYTPPELIDSVNEMEYITAIGPMMEYYSELWGEWQIEDKDQ
ncbi:hypothetical protein IIA79_07130, partial [bacterium]|nr:hypothetical protein [bacterium]